MLKKASNYVLGEKNPQRTPEGTPAIFLRLRPCWIAFLSIPLIPPCKAAQRAAVYFGCLTAYAHSVIYCPIDFVRQGERGMDGQFCSAGRSMGLPRWRLLFAREPEPDVDVELDEPGNAYHQP